jgi:hypothetical protein
VGAAADAEMHIDARTVHHPGVIVVARCMRSGRTTNWVAQRIRTEWLPTESLKWLFHFLATIAAAEDDRAGEDGFDRACRLQRLARDRDPEQAEVFAAVLAVSDVVLERVPLSWAIEALKHAAEANRDARSRSAA